MNINEELTQKIEKESDNYASGIGDQHRKWAAKHGYIGGATAYATRAITAEQENAEAKKLLNEVFQKHESGLLPDRFVYDKIKEFLYPENI